MYSQCSYVYCCIIYKSYVKLLKGIMMKIKNNKGFVGVDITIALLLLIIAVPTIAGIVYNTNKSNSAIERQLQAVNIATNAMEEFKLVIYEDTDINYLEDICEKIEILYSTELVSSAEVTNATTEIWTDNNVNYSIPTGTINLKINDIIYQLKISVQDNHQTDNTVNVGEKKIIRIKVIYKIGSEQKTIDLKAYFTLT